MFDRTSLSRSLSRLPILLLALVVALSLTACNKRLAELSLKGARKNVQQARSDEAERFNPDMLKQVEQQIEKAQGELNQGAAEAARETARAAKEESARLSDKTKADRAQALKTQAAADVNVAKINRGQQVNEVLYNEILDLNTQAEEALNKTKYEKTIDLCIMVHDKVDTLLQQLKTQAEDELRQRRNEFDTLLREGGREEAPKYVTESETKIADIDKLIAQDRNYVLAIQKAAELKTLIADGITEAFRSRAGKKIEMLENQQTRAILEGAEKYQPELLASCQETFRTILANHYSQKYQQVLEGADLLEPRLDTLILETRILAAKDSMDQVRKAIRGLEADKVREYLPGDLDKVEKMLEKAEGEFKQDLYDDCKKTCQIALEEKEAILKKFDELASKEIRDASAKLAEAEALLKRMAEIFDVQSPQSPDSLEQAFENSKKSLKTVLDNIAREAGILLGAAGVQREDKQFSNSIESARTVVTKSNYVTREVFHVVAHNNVLELAQRISQVEKNGGAQFASGPLKAAKDELEKARAMIRKEEKGASADEKTINPEAYRGAVTQTSESNATIETAVQQIIQTASAKIEAAEKAIGVADGNQAGVYALGEITTARGVLDQARQAFGGAQYYKSAQQADQSRQIAVDANTKSLRAWAGKEITDAQAEYDKAAEAHAAQFAAPLFQQAGDKLATSRKLFEDAASQGAPQESAKTLTASKDLAIEARKDAGAARLQPVTDANQAIVTAKRFGAWENDYVMVMNAVINARNALEAMDNGDFAIAKVYADKAAGQALQAAQEAKQATYAERMSEVNGELSKTARDGAGFYLPKAVRALAEQLGDVRRGYTVERFETVSAQISEIERNIFQVAQATPQVFDKLHKSQQAFYEDLKGKGASDFAGDRMSRAEQMLRFSRMDFDAGRFPSSYENLMNAARTLDSVQTEYDEHAFTTEVRSQVARLMEEKQSIDPLLEITRPTLQYVLQMPNPRNSTSAILAGTNPVEFREAMDDLYKRAIGTPYPVTMEAEHKQLIDVMLLARRSGIEFEKLIILNQYDEETAWKVVDGAFALMEQCMAAKNDLSKRFERKGLQGDLATLERVIGN